MEKLEQLKERLRVYYEAERAILRGAEYQIGSRRLRRADLSAVQRQISALEEEIALLEPKKGGRVKRVVFIE